MWCIRDINEEGDGHDKQRKVTAQTPRPAPMVTNTLQQVASAISLCCVRIYVFTLPLSIYLSTPVLSIYAL